MGILWSLCAYFLISKLEKNNSEKAFTYTLSVRFGVSIIFGTLCLAIINNYLTYLIGGFLTGITIFLFPAIFLVIFFIYDRKSSLDLLSNKSVLMFLGVPLFLMLLVAFPLEKWFSNGRFYVDLDFHVNRVAQQAFADPRSWPQSSVSFPVRLPYIAFIGDSLVSQVFRFLSFERNPFHYAETLFVWAIFIWSSLIFIMGSIKKFLLAIIIILIVLPFIMWGKDEVFNLIYTIFHANPNDLVAYPVGFSLIFYIFQSFFTSKTRPSLLTLALIPPTVIFFKPNEAPAFLFLQILGFILSIKKRAVAKQIVALWMILSIVAWLLFLYMARFMGSLAVSLSFHPSLSNLLYYSRVVFSSEESILSFISDWSRYVLTIYGMSLLAVFSTVQFSNSRNSLYKFRSILLHDLTYPFGIFLVAIVYLLSWWFAIPHTPNTGGGEPMHVNFILIMWFSAVILYHSILPAFKTKPLKNNQITLFLLAVFIYSLFSKNEPLMKLLEAHPNRSLAAVQKIRADVRKFIPEGHCFDYGKKYALYVNDLEVDEFRNIDFLGAATGCPLVKGLRWRGLLGDKKEEVPKNARTIDLSSEGGVWNIVHYNTKDEIFR